MKFKTSLPKKRIEIAGPALDPAYLLPEYKPVSCEFTDELEHFCVLQEIVLIKFWDENLKLMECEGRIVDVFSRDRSEFIKMDSGTEMRLDRIFSVMSV